MKTWSKHTSNIKYKTHEAFNDIFFLRWDVCYSCLTENNIKSLNRFFLLLFSFVWRRTRNCNKISNTQNMGRSSNVNALQFIFCRKYFPWIVFVKYFCEIFLRVSMWFLYSQANDSLVKAIIYLAAELGGQFVWVIKVQSK